MTKNESKKILKVLQKALKVMVKDKQHSMEHKHVDMSKVYELKEGDFEGMCPGQRAKIKKIRLRQFREIG